MYLHIGMPNEMKAPFDRTTYSTAVNSHGLVKCAVHSIVDVWMVEVEVEVETDIKGASIKSIKIVC